MKMMGSEFLANRTGNLQFSRTQTARGIDPVLDWGQRGMDMLSLYLSLRGLR